MDLTVTTYLLYLGLSVPLTVWVGRALQRHGQVFLIDVFQGDEGIARSVNQLLAIGFYLVNLGWVALFLRTTRTVESARHLLEVLSSKVGGVALVLGLVHVANVWAFNGLRRRAVLRARALPPVLPNGLTPVVPTATAAGATAASGWAAPGAANARR